MQYATARPRVVLESLESRVLLAWSSYAQLVDQDAAASKHSSITGEGVTIAVIDTGVDYTRPELGDGFGAGHKVVAGYDFHADDADPMDESGHGTAVAGVLAADRFTYNGVTYRGVAPDARLVALRVGTDSTISNDNIERALRWIVDHHDDHDISIVNLSLGSGNYADREMNDQLGDEFATLRNLGIFVVAASGNDNDALAGPISTDGVSYPAADPNVFAVGAVNAGDVITSWSQRGDELDLLAPGENVVSLKRGGGYERVDGTSFAAPYVAGAAALIEQIDGSARAGDIGSILMTSGVNNRDGDVETGNTTTLQFSRLDIDAALALTGQRRGRTVSIAADTSPDFGTFFDTALDSQGILHAAWYDDAAGRLLYATRDAQGLWSQASVVDGTGDVGAMPSIAVDATGKIGVAYFDLTNTAVKYATFGSGRWWTKTVESDKHVGSNPSLAYDIDGNAYLSYYKRSGGNLRLAILDRDANTWLRSTVDGLDGANVGLDPSLDVGEVAIRPGLGFTRYDTAVAIAYADTTNGDVKYARLDVDDVTAEWYMAVVEDANGVAHVELDLHRGPQGVESQAQIVYQDTSTADVKYAYRNVDWFVETAASTGRLGDTTQLYFDAGGSPVAVYFDRLKRALYAATRDGGTWWTQRVSASSSAMTLAVNQRTDQAVLTYLDRDRVGLFSRVLV